MVFNKRVRYYLAIISLVLGIVLLFNAAYIQLKAALAQVLIASAFIKQSQESSLQKSERMTFKPWPWADMTVIAKITINGNSDYVLSNASMRNLAFGPTHMSQSPLPGSNGNSVIVGHRDTHFAHLQHIQVGDNIQVQSLHEKIEYRVSEISIVDASQVSVLNNINAKALTLITCYPFHAIHPKPTKRWVVRAIQVG